MYTIFHWKNNSKKSVCLILTKKISTWVYWKVFCHFWPIKLHNLVAHVHNVDRLLLFFQKFTSTIPFVAWFQDCCQIKGEYLGVLFDRKLNVQSFTFWIWTEEFWIWFIWNLEENTKMCIVFKSSKLKVVLPYRTCCHHIQVLT